jgi:hypothetical protein
MGQKEMAVKKTAKTRTHFAYRIDIWSKPFSCVMSLVELLSKKWWGSLVGHRAELRTNLAHT